jgi:hypothetical protein
MSCGRRDQQGPRRRDVEKPSAAKGEAELVFGVGVREYLEQELNGKL